MMASPSGEVTCHTEDDSSYSMKAQVRKASADRATRAESGAACEASTIDKPLKCWATKIKDKWYARAESSTAREASTGDEPTLPLMADIMRGPNTPIAKGFLMAQWRTIPVDRLFGEHHTLSDVKVQTELHKMLLKVDSIWAALDCSTKTRCRNIPSKLPGRNLPPPLRSDEHPRGLPGLQGSDK